jgi:hypothetical protein
VRLRYGGEATVESEGKSAKTAGREGNDSKKDSGSSFGSNGAENRSLISLGTCESMHGWTDLFHLSVDGQSAQRTQEKERTSALRPVASWRLCASYLVFSHFLSGGFRLQWSASSTSLHSATPVGARDIKVKADASDVARARPRRVGASCPRYNILPRIPREGQSLPLSCCGPQVASPRAELRPPRILMPGDVKFAAHVAAFHSLAPWRLCAPEMRLATVQRAVS